MKSSQPKDAQIKTIRFYKNNPEKLVPKIKELQKRLKTLQELKAPKPITELLKKEIKGALILQKYKNRFPATEIMEIINN